MIACSFLGLSFMNSSIEISREVVLLLLPSVLYQQKEQKRKVAADAQFPMSFTYESKLQSVEIKVHKWLH
jgi:predicted PP-loop superfamily ATPase